MSSQVHPFWFFFHEASRLLVFSILCLGLFTSCDIFDSRPDYAIETEMRSDRVRVRNTGSKDVYASVFGESFLATVTIQPILNDRLKIRPGDVRTYCLADVQGAENETRLVVLWWNAVFEDGQARAGNLRVKKINRSQDAMSNETVCP